LSFDVTEDGTHPPQTVSATFVGDGVVVGTLPGQTEPAWLSVSGPGTAVGGQASFQVSVSPGTAAGNYSFTLRFATGKADGSQVVYVDLPVTATVHESFALVGGTFTFTGLEGGTAATATGSTALTIKGENVSWHASATQSWIQLPQTSGNVRGPLPFSISLQGLQAGYYNGTINVSDDVSGKSTFAIVQLTVSLAQPTVSLQSIQFNVNATTTSADVQADLVLSDQLQGQNAAKSFQWSLSPSAPVVRATPANGNTTGSPTHVSITLDRTKLNGMLSQTLKTQVVIYFQSAAYPNMPPAALAVPITLAVRLPRANTATPFIVSSNTPRRISIIGNDFQDEDLPRMSIAGIASPSLTRLSSQEIAIDLPALATGQYPVSFQNTLGLTRSLAEISVQGPPLLGAGVMVSSGRKGRLVVDAARSMIYAVNPGTQQIERYHWDGANWSALAAVSVPQVHDITLARNGRELYASADDGYHSLDLTSSAPSPTTLITIPTGFCESAPASIVTTELGGLMGSLAGNSCTADGWAGDVLTYDALSSSLLVQGELERTVTWFFSHARLATSADGRYLAIGEVGDSGGEFGLFDLRADTFLKLISPANFAGGFYSMALDMDGAATKIVVNNTDVRSPTTAEILGHLPDNRIARLSADGTKAYIYIHADGGLGKIQVIDLTASIAPSDTFPVLAEIPVPYDMGDSPAEIAIPSMQPNFAMTLSPDERLAFLSGTARIVSISLP
jgi:hypothetical protein